MSKQTLSISDWKNSNIQVFWGEIAPCDHLVQFYDTERNFLETLEGFAGCGLLSGDSVVVLATGEHLDQLNERLIRQGFDLQTMLATDQYITIDAEDALNAFMVNGWPDEKLFGEFVAGVLSRAQQQDRKVRAFGELVAVLWENGNSGATVHLENLWCGLHEKQNFTLYCAYPKSGFTQHAHDSIDTICKTHSMVIDGEARPSTEIYYRSVQ
jgi:hypothetical protein